MYDAMHGSMRVMNIGMGGGLGGLILYTHVKYVHVYFNNIKMYGNCSC